MLVALLAQKAEIKYDKLLISDAHELVEAVRDLGFGCQVMDKAGQGEGVVEIIVSAFDHVTMYMENMLYECTGHCFCHTVHRYGC